MAELIWISEAVALPLVGQPVLLLVPRMNSEHADLVTAVLRIQHEGVVPRPVQPGDGMPTTYYWGLGSGARGDDMLVSGRGHWARVTGLNLPPGILHQEIRGYNCLIQEGSPWLR